MAEMEGYPQLVHDPANSLYTPGLFHAANEEIGDLPSTYAVYGVLATQPVRRVGTAIQHDRHCTSNAPEALLFAEADVELADTEAHLAWRDHMGAVAYHLDPEVVHGRRGGSRDRSEA